MATYDHDKPVNDYVPPWEQDPATHDEILALIEAEENDLPDIEDEVIEIYNERTGKTKHLKRSELSERQLCAYGQSVQGSHHARIIELRNSREPKPGQKLKIERFVQEYVKDFRAKEAAMRMGLSEGYASQFANATLKLSYTLRIIREWLERVDEEVLVDRRRIILGLMHEAQYYGQGSSHAARVAAWAKLAKLTGMEIDRVQAEVTFHHVMRVPERSLDVSAWEEQASAEQAQLKHDVRN